MSYEEQLRHQSTNRTEEYREQGIRRNTEETFPGMSTYDNILFDFIQARDKLSFILLKITENKSLKYFTSNNSKIIFENLNLLLENNGLFQKLKKFKYKEDTIDISDEEVKDYCMLFVYMLFLDNNMFDIVLISFLQFKRFDFLCFVDNFYHSFIASIDDLEINPSIILYISFMRYHILVHNRKMPIYNEIMKDNSKIDDLFLFTDFNLLSNIDLDKFPIRLKIEKIGDTCYCIDTPLFYVNKNQRIVLFVYLILGCILIFISFLVIWIAYVVNK